MFTMVMMVKLLKCQVLPVIMQLRLVLENFLLSWFIFSLDLSFLHRFLLFQLAQARSTGLLNLIDNYKSSLEAVVGKRSREATQLLKVFMDIEENLKAF